MVNPLDLEENLKSQLNLNKFSRWFSKYILSKRIGPIKCTSLANLFHFFANCYKSRSTVIFFANFCQFFFIFLRIFSIPCQPSSVCFFIIFGRSSRISANLCQSCTSFFLQFSLARHGKCVSFASSRGGNSQLKHRQIVSHVFAKLLQSSSEMEVAPRNTLLTWLAV